MECRQTDGRLLTDVRHDLPVIGQIQELYLVDGTNVTFLLKVYKTTYELHYCAYVLHITYEEKTLQLSSIFIEVPVKSTICRATCFYYFTFCIVHFVI